MEPVMESTNLTTSARLRRVATFALAALVFGGSAAALAQHAGPPNFDTDGDGLVSEDEFVAVGARRGERLDTDGDGTISADEVAVMRARHEERVEERGAEIDAEHEARRAEHEARFEAADLNSDGALDPTEREEMARVRFAELDQDGDGSLTEDELRAGMPHGGPGGHGPGGHGPGSCEGRGQSER
jgi:Ca2+-binding EF-hand superfamily protein